MASSVVDFMEQLDVMDPSWRNAYALVSKHLNVSTHVSLLFKSAWQGGGDPGEFIKVIGFSKLNPLCLLTAAELVADPDSRKAAGVERALSSLGVRLAAVILAINLTCRIILKDKPPPGWKQLFQEMITNIEIGYRIGAKVFEIGVEGGALLGFAREAGLALMLRENNKALRQCLKESGKSYSVDRQLARKLFGCEPYQVAALALQHLGFGHQLAIGFASAEDTFDGGQELEREAMRWKAAREWLDALRESRNYPASLASRNFYPELIPPRFGQARNTLLDVLYTEIAKIKDEGSRWNWHLTRPASEQAASESGN